MNRVVLNNVQHGDLKVALRSGPAYGDAVNRMMLFPSEFEEAQRDFPIFFRETDEGLRAIALLGFDADENLFLDGDRWTSSYVPAFQRRGPFSIGLERPHDGAESGDLTVQVDLDDSRVGADDGLPMFLEHGGNAPYLDHITGVLRLIYDGLTNGDAVYGAFRDAGLLQPVTLQIHLDDENGYDLPDMLTIDQRALADLSGEALETLHRSGLLRAAMMVAASLGNVQRLIDRKNRKRAAD